MRKKLFAAAVMGAVGAAAGIGTAGAADAAYVLDEVVVIGKDVYKRQGLRLRDQRGYVRGGNDRLGGGSGRSSKSAGLYPDGRFFRRDRQSKERCV